MTGLGRVHIYHTRGGTNVEKQQVRIGGRLGTGGEGSLRLVEFVGEQLATRTVDVGNYESRTETLYKTDDGRFVVHVEDRVSFVLQEVTEMDLVGLNGRFEDLGREAGLWRPLTLDEALHEAPDEAPDEAF